MRSNNRDVYGVEHFLIWQPFLKNHPVLNSIITDHVACNAITLSTLMEHAIALINGSTVVDEVSFDLSDGSDAKYVTARKHGKRYSAGITGTKNKTGLIRAQAYEPMNKKFYWFCFPNDIYKQIKNEIEIPFTMTGDPARICTNKQLNLNWWKYEVGSFSEMAMIPNTENIPVIKNNKSTYDLMFVDEPDLKNQNQEACIL